ncbi:Regulatory protein AtoC [bioreactor metagenome]|uniref:Regulatory protein AtoC n=1 Tax=bioreactor metagenome TaxID=1076179 RepID=A0A644T9Z5_9ZZZZ|nr:sigma-54 dependent transcriptional regulator [Desulfitobacterium hafniense]MEA5024175.1 sigma-54 dependent transcriptional regulator [Desulfitobacterium hafniense]
MEPKANLLLVDDEEDLRQVMKKWFEDIGYHVDDAGSGCEALEALQKQEYEVAVFDIIMPDMDGVRLLEQTKKLQPTLQVIMLTGNATVDTAIEAMKLGAYDYLSKPCNLAKLELVVQKAMEKGQLIKYNRGLSLALKRRVGSEVIIGDSPQMEEIIKLAQKVADADSPVLLEGESGTGKEIIAQALHLWSLRADKPFIVVNMGSLPNQLLESELFGHEKGAFTGAVTAKEGLVELAAGGTLFLDEIGEMDLALQVNLLRFLQTGEFRRVGGTRLQRVKVRVITATNRYLEEEVREGRFREDLYYRLNVIKINLPPLRGRKGDIPLLAAYFLQKFAKGKALEFGEGVMETLTGYDFPGNIRELSNMIERGTILAEGNHIVAKDLFGGTMPQTMVGTSLKDAEKRHIASTLAAVNDNKDKAAKLLGISTRQLYRKIEQYDL